MSKVSPSPKTLIAEQQVPSDLKQPFLSGGGDTTTTSSNNTPQTDSPIKTQLPETNGASAFSRPQDMNKVSVSPSSDPISPPPEENNNNNNQKVEVTNSSTMAVPEDIAITTNTGTNNNHHHINEPSQTHAPNSNPLLKPVVTPDATPCKNVVVGEENDTDEPEKETEDRTDASSPEPHSSSSEGQPISPPRTPPSRVPSVIHPLPKGSLDHPEFSPPQGLVTANRGRILSLDRAKDTINDALSGKMDTAKALELPKDQDDKNIGDDQHKEEADNDDVDHDESSRDSSDGESSYFAKHLPSPRNGRRYSYSSNHSQHSAPARTSKSSLFNVPPAAATNSADANKASDASLSFSDDESDDDELPPHTTSESPEPVCPLPSQVADMQLQTITRVHSVSSLVSSNEDDESRARSPQSTLSKDSGTTSDPSFTAELQTVVASSSKQQEQEEHNHLSFHHNQMIPSGRRSPLPTNPAFMAYYNTSPSASGGAYANPSPPTIVPGYNVAGMPHPQPQMMTQDQLAAWMAVGGLQAQQQQRLLGSASKGGSSSDGGAGGGAIPFVYSDDETDDMPYLVNQFAGHGGQQEHGGGGAYNTFNGSGDGGINRESSSGNRGSGGGNGINNNQGQQDSYGTHQMGGGLLASGNNGGDFSDPGSEEHPDDVNYTVYWRRWIMLFYMSILNLLSDWTCYSVAPIAILTKETFGSIDPEQLVTIFLGANAIATACEPIILARLGLRKTVLFGALLLMIGSMIKSGGLPPIIEGKLVKGQDEWRLSLGFFLVGLSQPLYQCTPALLSASWFPEKERTMATGVALNANQLGIGCAFIFGTLLVSNSDDIPSYFGLLSIISTICFIGTLCQFDDAPPTPPSGTAKVMKGDLNIPNVNSIVESVRNMNIPGTIPPAGGDVKGDSDDNAETGARQRKVKSSSKKKVGTTRRRASRSPAPAPSPAYFGRVRDLVDDPVFQAYAEAPSPMMPGPTQREGQRDGGGSPLFDENGYPSSNMQQGGNPGPYVMYPGMPYPYAMPPSGQYGSIPPPNPYFDPRMMQQQQQYGYLQYGQQPYFYPPPPHPYYYGYQNAPPMYPPPPPYAEAYSGEFDEGAEPVLTITDHKLDINIRDDQVILSTRLCLSRPGFIHALVAFTVSGIVINTLSTFMDYLVRLNGAGRQYVGIVGGSFQIIIMCSSLIIGKQTDKTRAYYSVIIAMLVLGAFGLAECGVSLDANRGSDLRWSLLVVAALVGPLQPVSTELGVDVVYPLSENTVLVIQQLFSNLLSALFIPLFKSLRDVGITDSEENNAEHPQYTFSFYLLIVLHAGATVFFATFNGRYLRYEHELEKAAAKEQRRLNKEQGSTAFYPVHQGGKGSSLGDSYSNSYDDPDSERQPLTTSQGHPTI